MPARRPFRSTMPNWPDWNAGSALSNLDDGFRIVALLRSRKTSIWFLMRVCRRLPGMRDADSLYTGLHAIRN